MAKNNEQAMSFQCKICEAALTKLGNLKQHDKSVHGKIEDHNCEECGKSFSLKPTLRGHVRAVHGKIKDHTCDEWIKISVVMM